MALKIGNLGILVAVLTFFGCIVRIYLEFTEIIPCGCKNVFTCVADPDCKPLTFELSTSNRLWIILLNTFIVLIALIVAAIPEGLPLAVSISLSFGCKQMLRYNNLVRKLSSCETMGGATVICTDKTGTLTKNQMSVIKSFT